MKTMKTKSLNLKKKLYTMKKANSTQKVNTLISNQEWLNFAQEKPYLSKD